MSDQLITSIASFAASFVLAIVLSRVNYSNGYKRGYTDALRKVNEMMDAKGHK